MELTAILIPRSKAFAFAVILLFIAGMVFAQDARMVSPPLTMRTGTTLTVRLNQPLSSDHNQLADVFSATLAQPVVVLGIVVAQRGQTVIGHVVEAKKAGLVKGVSRLGITLTNLTLVDGRNVPIQSQLLVRSGPTSVGRDAAAIAGTTGLGAAIGAAANWGRGAAIGAAAGAAAGAIGVLFTRGYPTVVDPETLLTFQTTAPVKIETNSAPQAFRFVQADDYPAERQSQEAPTLAYPPPAPLAYPYPYYPPSSYPYYYPYPTYYYPYYGYRPYYPYYGYPNFYGPSLTFFFGYPGYHGYHGFFGYRGHYGYPGHYSYGNAPRPVAYRGNTIVHSFYGGGHH